MREHFSLTLNTNFEDIERLQDRVSEAGERLEYPPKTLFQINLALEEILTNVVKYAYAAASPRQYSVEISMDENEFQAEVVDSGRAFNPLEAPPPDLDLPIEKRPIGGLGIHLVRSIMDHVAYRRAEERNHFQMRKQISRA